MRRKPGRRLDPAFGEMRGKIVQCRWLGLVFWIGASMGAKPSDDSYSETETVERREAALRRMLSTPHKPHKAGKKKTRKSRVAKKSRS